MRPHARVAAASDPVALAVAMASNGVGLPSRRSSPTGLPVSVFVAERAEQVVAELEGLAERKAVARTAARRVAASYLARPARRRGGGAARPCTCPTCTARCARAAPRSRSPSRRAHEVEVLADVELDAQLVPHRDRRCGGAPRSSCRRTRAARSPIRIATPSPKRRASPRHSRSRCVLGEREVRGSGRPRRVDDPSMTSSWTSANAWSSSKAAPASATSGLGGVAAGADERPVAERRTEPFAAGEQEIAERPQRGDQGGIEPLPPGQLAVEKGSKALLDARCDDEKARRYGGHRSQNPIAINSAEPATSVAKSMGSPPRSGDHAFTCPLLTQNSQRPSADHTN